MSETALEHNSSETTNTGRFPVNEILSSDKWLQLPYVRKNYYYVTAYDKLCPSF